MTELTGRVSALASRHVALGSDLEDWNGMGTAWSYDSSPEAEHDAVRENVGMFDMSPLKKVMITGEQAASVLDHLTTRDMGKLAPGQAAYLSVLTENGTIADDAIVYHLDSGKWMIVHGAGDTMNLLLESSKGKAVNVKLNDDLHDISVQGPNSLHILQSGCDADIAGLRYFEHVRTRFFGNECLVSRTGYSGERGYEVFADSTVVCDIWDGLVLAGVMPCSFTALDKLRIEAGFLFYGYDMTTQHTPFEVGLGFTVTKGKSGYRGFDVLQQARGQEKISNVTLEIDHSDMLAGQEALLAGEQEVGIVNSPCYSHRLDKSLALAHVKPEFATPGTSLSVADGVTVYTANVVATPVYDPNKTRTHAN